MALGRRHSYTPRVSFSHNLNTYIRVRLVVHTKTNTNLLEHFVSGAYYAVAVGIGLFISSVFSSGKL